MEYYFECYPDDRFNSVWLSFELGEPCTYTVLIGSKSQIHKFRVKARDLYGNKTDWSDELPMEPLPVFTGYKQ